MTIQEMKDLKKELGLSNDEISRRSGVPFGTVQKIFSGATTAPRSKTIQALEAVLKHPESQGRHPEPDQGQYQSPYHSQMNTGLPVSHLQGEKDKYTSLVQESAAAHSVKRQGNYTIEDYYSVPDERRVELIDGVIYDMSAPSLLHQRILLELALQFESCASGHSRNCEVFISPCDVQFDRDEKTIMQPDLFVLCKGYDIKARCIPGAPDLTLEILSSSTRSKDMLLKTYKYLNAGVREYWIVDPEGRQILVYIFEESETVPKKYSFEDTIPIHISDGRCSVDFGKIYRKIAAYYVE